ncbi:hypothetical protein Aab01nite_00670 [Paractinoplanes abujensis]|uniref:Membrane protein implicated in regulation of membrane protease activity n=1 Tax=Paractinoplanes abujensis TaxID=882441 RepID=A0A7W7FZI5_9ACTN|nr:hypothetical protein [Actinoplanes abujensis]MBB4692108.1 membrane protein implicated in regulation of membrane protease activity [Actinoplanes abujensis]GID16477.1 hypothetical protein Aab01nite_00670 [Actinoplanes abujensis]
MRGSRAATLNRTERWFVRAALPQLIVGFTARDQVVPRMLPFLTGASIYWLLQAASVGTFVALAVPLLATALVWPFTAGLNGRRPPRLGRAGTIGAGVFFAAVFIAGGSLLYRVRPGAFGREVAAQDRTWLIVGVAGLLVFAATFAGGFLATSYGVVAALRHAVGDLAKGLAGIPRSFGRSLPVVLFGTVFLFFTGELWQLLDRLPWPRVWLVLALLTVIVALATWRVVRGYDEDPVGPPPTREDLAEACAGTPLAGVDVEAVDVRPLEQRQALNVLVLLTVRQLVQAAVIGFGLFLFFATLGLITVQQETAATWIGHDPEPSGLLGLPMALFKLAALLASFGGVSFATTSMTNLEYRKEFFEPVLESIRRPILVHAVYRKLAGETR